MSERPFADDKLGGVGSIETINAIGSRHAVLHLTRARVAVASVEETGGRHNFFRDDLQSTDNVLVPTLRRTTHVPRAVDDLLFGGKKLIKVVDCIRELVQQLGFSWRSFSCLDQIQYVDRCTVSLE